MLVFVSVMRRLSGKVVWSAVLLLVSSWLLGAMSGSAGAATTAATTTTTTTTQPAPNVNSSADGWLSLAAILFGVVVSAGLLWVVSKDRRESREAVLAVLSAGVSDVTESDTPVNAAAALGAVTTAAQLMITADHDSFQVGTTVTLTAENNNQPVPSRWTFAPTGIVSTSGDGPNSNLVVTGVKAGTVTATAVWTDPEAAAGTPPRTGTKKLTVAAQKSSPVNFAVLGSGLGSSVLALLAISGAIALAFRGTFSAEIGTLLGTALGAGAAGAVSATHSANNNSQPPAPPKSGTS
ncbi:MAG TPA: hypothetical protein VHU85_04360 [Acidimicrobiales bacterium]|jgi:hypothetical protein|nr:hypothetical protein [Acidimicrobiales bacterium]